MVEQADVVANYSHGNLLDAIRVGVAALGKTPETVTLEDLAAVDEFHIGGRQASEGFVGQLGLREDHHVLDVGCGVGGTARFIAATTGARVSGLDLTPEFVETGRVLCAWVGQEDRVALHQGSALAMPFEAGGFDAATMLHVGMNIPDKAALFTEVARVLEPGGVFGVYDIMQTGEAPPAYPMPWAAEPGTSALAPPETYREALAGAGFEILSERNRRDFATAFFDALKRRIAAAGGPPPLGLHILMGETAPAKFGNMVEHVVAGRIAPVEIIARKAS